jgi:putative ABC transport system substrate-binding protein
MKIKCGLFEWWTKRPFFFLGTFLLCMVLSGCVQKPKVYQVGILTCLDYFAPILDGFKEGMTKLGYVENKNILYDIKKLPEEGEAEIQQIIEKFIADKVDLIVVAPTVTALKTKAVTMKSGIPVVFAAAFTEGNDLVESIRQPGGNITGVRWPSSAEIAIKTLEVLHQMMPHVKRVWVGIQKDYTTKQFQIDPLRSAAESSGIAIVEVPFRNVKDIRTDLDTRDKSGDIGLDAFFLMGAPLASLGEGFAIITGFALRHKIPIIGPSSDITILSLKPEAYKSGKQSAYLADKILKGAPAGTIPVLTLENTLIINYRAIQKMGWHINENIPSQADEIIR